MADDKEHDVLQEFEKPKVGYNRIQFPEQNTEKPTFTETFGAVWNNNDIVNIVGAAGKAFKNNFLAQSQDDDFDYYAEDHYAGIPVPYQEKIANAVATGNSKEVQKARQGVFDDLRDQDILGRSGFVGGALSLASGIISPTTLIPLGASIKYAQAGKGFVSGVKQIVPTAVVSSMVSRTAESMNHEAFGAKEWFEGVMLDSVLNSGIAGLVGLKGMWTAKGIQKVQGSLTAHFDDVDIKIKTGPKGEFEGYQAMSNNGSASAARTQTVQTLLDNGIAGVGENYFFKKAFSLSPVVKGLTSQFNTIRQLTNRMYRHNLVTGAIEKGHIENVATAQDIHMDYKGLSDAVQVDIKNAWIGYVGIDSGIVKGPRAWSEAKKKGLLSEQDFRSEIAVAMRNGDKHATPEVAAQAQNIRKHVYEPMFNKLVELGRLDPNIEVATAISYLNRVYDKSIVTAHYDDFIDVGVEHFMDCNRLIGAHTAPITIADGRIKELRAQLKQKGLTPEVKNKSRAELESIIKERDTKREELQKLIDEGKIPLKLLTGRDELSPALRDEFAAITEPVTKASKELKEAQEQLIKLGTVGNFKNFADIELQNISEKVIGEALKDIHVLGKKGTLAKMQSDFNESLKLYKEKKESLKTLKEKLDKVSSESERMHTSSTKKVKETLAKEYEKAKTTVLTYEREKIARKQVINELREVLKGKLFSPEEIEAVVKEGQKASKGVTRESVKAQQARTSQARTIVKNKRTQVKFAEEQLQSKLIQDEVSEELFYMTKKGKLKLINPEKKPWFRKPIKDTDIRTLAKEVADTILEENEEQMAGRIFGQVSKGGSANPLKERSYLIEDEKIQKFLVNDVNVLMDNYANGLGKVIGLDEMYKKYALNPKDGKQSLVKSLREEYDGMRQNVLNTPDSPERTKELLALKKEFESAENFMADMYKVFMGNYVDLRSPEKRTTTALRNYFVSTQLGGLLITSLTDTVLPLFRFGFLEYLEEGVVPVLKNFKKLMIDGGAQRADFGDARVALETALGGMMDEKWGSGTQYQPKTAWERIPKNLAQLSGNLNFSNQFSDITQTMVAMASQSKTLRELEQFVTTGKLDQKQLERFGKLALDPGEWGTRIINQVKKYGENVEGSWIANTRNWSDIDAAQAFRIALNRDVKASLSIQNSFDMPMWFRKPVIDCITQYMSWGFGATNNLAIPLLQRFDAEKAVGLFAVMSLGAFIGPLRQLASGREVDLSAGALMGGALFDSGILGHNGDIMSKLNSMLRIPYLEHLKQDKYRMKTPWQILGGPLGGTLESAQRMVNMFLSGEINQNDMARGIKLLPYADNVLLRRPMSTLLKNSGLPETAGEARALKGE
jgi:hypothetical protein